MYCGVCEKLFQVLWKTEESSFKMLYEKEELSLIREEEFKPNLQPADS